MSSQKQKIPFKMQHCFFLFIGISNFPFPYTLKKSFSVSLIAKYVRLFMLRLSKYL